MRVDYLEILFDIVKDKIDKIKPEIENITGGTEGLTGYVNNNFGPNGQISQDDLIEYVNVARTYFLMAQEIIDLKDETITLNRIRIVNTEKQESFDGDSAFSDVEKDYIIDTKLDESVDFKEFFTVIKYLRYIGAVGRNLRMRILCRALRATTESPTNKNPFNGNVICMLDCFYSMIKKEYIVGIKGKKADGAGNTSSKIDRLNQLTAMKTVLEKWANEELMDYLNKDENQDIMKIYLGLDRTKIEEGAVSYYKKILKKFFDGESYNAGSDLPGLSTEDRLLIYFKSIRGFDNRRNDSFNKRADVKIYCYYLYFCLSLIIPSLYNTDSFDKLFVESGYDSEMTVLPYTHSAVTYRSIIKKETYKEWLSNLKKDYKWAEDSDIKPQLNFTSESNDDSVGQEDSGRCDDGMDNNEDNVENDSSDGSEKGKKENGISYETWLEKLKKGYDQSGLEKDEADEATYLSLQIIRNNLLSGGDWNEKSKKETYSLIKDAEYRRVWYFNRLIYKILKAQENASFIKESKSEIIRNELEEERFLFSWRGAKNIKIPDVARAFNFCFSDDGVAFADLEWRKKSFYLSEQIFTKEEKEDYDKAKESGKSVITDYLEFSPHKGKERKGIMPGRQFLLLMALLCKLYCPADIDLTYVNTHLLMNSRFDKLQPKYSDFDQYFEYAFKLMDCHRDIFIIRLSILQTLTRNYEESILDPEDKKNEGPLQKIMENKG